MNRALGTELRSLIAQLDGGVQTIYDEIGIPFRPRFYPIVQALISETPLSIGQIADRLGVSQPAATQTVAEMRKLNLVAVSAGHDRRARMVELTPDAARLAGRLRPVWLAIHDAANTLDTELSASIATILQEASAALGRQQFADRIRTELARQKQ